MRTTTKAATTTAATDNPTPKIMSNEWEELEELLDLLSIVLSKPPPSSNPPSPPPVENRAIVFFHSFKFECNQFKNDQLKHLMRLARPYLTFIITALITAFIIATFVTAFIIALWPKLVVNLRAMFLLNVS